MIDLGCVDAIDTPSEYFARFRPDGAVQWSDVHRAWVVIGHREVAAGFRDGDRLSTDRITALERVAGDRPAAFGRLVELLRGWMIFRDPPEHGRLRRPVRDVFTPRQVDSMSGLVEGVVDEVFASLPDPEAGGVIDVRRELAGPLPALVIAEILGVPGEYRKSFQHWSDQLATVVFSTEMATTPPTEAMVATDRFADFFGELIDDQRRDPKPTLLGRLIMEAESTAGTDQALSTMELIGACTLLLFAGHETTTGLLANTIGLMMEQPGVLVRFREAGGRPGADEAAVEEFMRVAGPARTMFRRATCDHVRGGAPVRAGDTVALVIAAANHDPAVFDDPDRVDLARSPNPHLGFGWGLHHCVGANLARLEANLALRRLVDRYPSIEAVGPTPRRVGNVLGYAVDPLTIRVSA